jgi:hypothetical protein
MTSPNAAGPVVITNTQQQWEYTWFYKTGKNVLEDAGNKADELGLAG